MKTSLARLLLMLVIPGALLTYANIDSHLLKADASFTISEEVSVPSHSAGEDLDVGSTDQNVNFLPSCQQSFQSEDSNPHAAGGCGECQREVPNQPGTFVDGRLVNGYCIICRFAT